MTERKTRRPRQARHPGTGGITERKQAQEALRESEEKYRRLVECSIDGIAIVEGLDIRFVNPALLHVFGCHSEEEMVGRPFTDFVAPDHRQLMAERGRGREEGQEVPARYEFRALRKDGSEFDAEISVGRITFEGRVARQGIVRDISERKRAEEALRESEHRLRTVVRNAPVFLFAVDREGIITLSEGKGLESIGRRPGEAVGCSALELYANVPEVIENVRRALAGETFSATVELPGGTLEIHHAPIRDQEGQVSGFIGVATDVTERKRAEDMLRIQRDLAIPLSTAVDLHETLRLSLQAAIRASGMDCGGIYLIDESSGALDLACHQGLSPDFVKSVSHYDADSPNVRLVLAGEPVYTPYDELAVPKDESERREGLRTIAVVPVRHLGESMACLNVASRTADDVPVASRNAVEAIAGQIGSVIVRRRAEEALRESEERYRSLVEASPDAIFLTDLDANIIMSNEQGARLHGFKDAEDLLSSGINAFDFIAPEDRERAADNARKTLETGFVRDVEYTLLRKDGTSFPGELSASLITDADGKPRAFTAVTRDITERKRAEEALRESESKYRDLVETLAAAAFIFQGTEMRYVNAAAEAMTSYTQKELLGMNFWDVIHPDFRELVKERGEARQRGGPVPLTYEVKILTKSGEERWVDFTAAAIEFEGKPAVLGTAFNITERKRAEEALRESEAKYRQIFENIQDIFYRTDTNGIITEVSPSVERYGFRREELIGRSVIDAYVDPEDRAAHMKALAEHGEVLDYELRLKSPDGRRVGFASVSARLLRGDDGAVDGVEGMMRNITDRKRAEEALREREQRLREVLEASRDLTYKVDLETGEFYYASPAVRQLTGFTAEELIAMGLRGVVRAMHPEDRRRFDGVRPGPGAVADLAPTFEYRWQCKDGEYRWLSNNWVLVPDNDGRPIAMVGTVRDITESKRAEEALRESEERFRTLSQAALEGILIHENGTILDANRALYVMLGYELSEALETELLNFVAPEWRDLVRKKAVSRHEEHYEATAVKKDGTPMTLEIRGGPMSYRGRAARVVAIRDVTERKRAEDALRHAREELEEKVERRLQRDNPYGLTFRELTVLHVAAAGKSDREIARQLGISPLTARKHVENILAKMGSTSRTEASVRALREGLLD